MTAADSRSASQPPTAPAQPRAGRLLALCGAFAALYYSMYPPADLDLLAFVALIPLLILIESLPSGWRLLRWAWFAGLLAFSACFVWARHVSWAGVFGCGGFCGMYVALFAVLLRPVAPRPSFAGWAFCSAAWAGTEYLRGVLLLGGIPWFLLGHTQYKVVPVMQITDITGVYGLSFLLAGINYLLYWGGSAFRRGPTASGRGFLAACVLQVLLTAGAVAYGFAVTPPAYPPDGPRIAVVQANIPQDLKEEALIEWGRRQGVVPDVPLDPEDYSRFTSGVVREIFDKHRRMSLAIQEDYDLLAWPETMSPYPLGEFAENAEVLGDMARRLDRDFLVGALTTAPLGPRRYRTSNSAYLFDRTGTVQARYDKMRLVPIGETVPGLHFIPFLEEVVLALSSIHSVPDLIPGDRMTIFRAGQHRFGVLICFDVIFPDLYREWTRRGAEYLVTLSNDGWFRDGAELEQTLIICQFGCAFSKTGMVRAMNTGISSVIDPYGRAEVLVGEGGKTKEVEGVLVRRVHLRRGTTVYMQVGDLFAQLCASVAVGGWLGSLLGARRRVLAEAGLVVSR